MKYTKQQIINMLRRNCVFDIQFGDGGNLNGVSMHILSDEDDYDIICDLIGISKEQRKEINYEAF